MLSILLKILPFFAIAALGFAVMKAELFEERGVRGLSRFVMFLALPALLFGRLATATADDLLNTHFLAAYLLAVLLAFAMAAGLGVLLFRGGPSHAALYGLAGTYGNIGFLGLPLLTALAGDDLAIPLAMILTFDLVVLVPLASLAVRLGRGSGTVARGFSLAWLRAVLRNPLMLAIAAGAAFSIGGWPVPGAVLAFTDILSQAAAPCAMFVVGAVVAGGGIGARPWPALYMSLFKLLVFPAIVWATLGAAGVAEDWRMAASLGAAMPAAAVLSVIAEEQDILPGQASMAVLISTVISVLTIAAALTLI